jgi:hypothetical protein
MSVLDDFVRMRRYRNRAAEFDELADIEGFSVVGRRYRTIARHYRELADREERLDKARMVERLELLRVKRQAVAAQAALAAESNAQVLILRAGQAASSLACQSGNETTAAPFLIRLTDSSGGPQRLIVCL